jgi:hypothetical protein
LEKREAVSVLREIVDTCKDEIAVDWVSLDPLSVSISKNPERESGYLIKMKVGLNRYSREKINCVLEKHGLVLREEKGFVVISKASQ